MNQTIETIPYRTVYEWSLHSDFPYAEPFADVEVDAELTAPSGRTYTVPAFYDGEGVWRVRFNPGEVGQWQWRTSARPANPELTREGAFEVTARQTRGFLRATPGRAWGFHYESGEPAFLLGDTVYNLFGMAHCGGNTDAFLERRARQGFNLLRIRVPVSPFHGPHGYSEWQTRRTWPWGGSEQSPRFDRFNLDYFRTVDRVMQRIEQLGMGVEMIMEAWGFEFPFNCRHIFVPEWEELWMRYLIARYDAFNCLYFWTLMNEYEYYPDGNWQYNPVADRWAMRMGRWVRQVAPHGHLVAVHNGPNDPPFAQRFALHPEAIDAIMFQTWGTTGQDDGWLAAGIEERVAASLAGWWGSAVFAEYGYERNPDLPLHLPGHAFCDPEHTRRGAWRGAFCALGVIHGFENSWGPWMILEQDQPGMVYLLHLRRFFTEIVPFDRLRPAPQLVAPAEYVPGGRPLALATEELDVVAVYLPVGGAVTLDLSSGADRQAQWYDPRTGESRAARGNGLTFTSPEGVDDQGHPLDWVLTLCEK